MGSFLNTVNIVFTEPTSSGYIKQVAHLCGLCRVLLPHALQLQQYAQDRDAAAVVKFRAKVARMGSTAGMILAVDETSKDGRAMRRSSFGSTWRVRGRDFVTIGCSGLLPRGERVSALCSFDVTGFVAWEYTGNTFNRPRWWCAPGQTRPEARSSSCHDSSSPVRSVLHRSSSTLVCFPVLARSFSSMLQSTRASGLSTRLAVEVESSCGRRHTAGISRR